MTSYWKESELVETSNNYSVVYFCKFKCNLIPNSNPSEETNNLIFNVKHSELTLIVLDIYQYNKYILEYFKKKPLFIEVEQAKYKVSLEVFIKSVATIEVIELINSNSKFYKNIIEKLESSNSILDA